MIEKILVQTTKYDALAPAGFIDKMFWIIASSLFVLSIYRFQNEFNLAYKVVIILSVFGCLFVKDILGIITSKYGRALLIVGSVLACYALLEWGDRINKTSYLFLRSIPLFVLGYSVSQHRVARVYSLLTLLVGYGLSALMDLRHQSAFVGSSMVREQIAAIMQSSGIGLDDMIQSFIYYFPSLAFVFILSLSVFPLVRPAARIFVLGFVVCIGLSVLLSTWTAALTIMTLGVYIGAMLSLMARKTGAVKKRIFLLILVMIVLSMAVSYIASSWSSADKTDTNKYIYRITGLYALIVDPSDLATKIDHLTGGRLSIALISVGSFIAAPVFGIGDYDVSIGIGGHSTFADVFARYGIVGGVPICLMVFGWFWVALKNWRLERDKFQHTIMLTFFILYSVSIFFNPYLFMSSLDFVVFYAAGLSAGDNAALMMRLNAKKLSAYNKQYKPGLVMANAASCNN